LAGPRPRHPRPIDGAAEFFRNLLGLQLERSGAHHTVCESRCGPDEGSHRPEKQPDPRVGGKRPSRPRHRRTLGFASAYVFGVSVCPSEASGGADHSNLCIPRGGGWNQPSSLCEISSQVSGRCPSVVMPRGCRLAPEPGDSWRRQYHFVGAAPYSRISIPVDRIWATISSASVNGSPTRCFPAWRHHGCLARWPGPICQQPRPGPHRSAQSLGLRLFAPLPS